MRNVARRVGAMAVWLAVGLGWTSCKRAAPSGGSAAGASATQGEVQKPVNGNRLDPAEARVARERLVHQIQVSNHPWGGEEKWDPRVLAAMRAVPRHLFVPQASLPAAYRDRPHPIGHGQTISQPTVVALMTQALHLEGGEKVLEIGTGSAYQAAVLSGLAREIYSIERIEALGKSAKQRLASLGYHNVVTKVGDGYQGWPEQAPFARILLTAAPPKVPAALVEQLAEGGILVAPVGELQQTLVRWRKLDGQLHKEELGAVRFVPMVPDR